MRIGAVLVILLLLIPTGGAVAAGSEPVRTQEVVSGPLVPLPEPEEKARLENINEVADSYGGFTASHVQVLYRGDTPYLVASKESIPPGEATVSGLVFTPSELTGVSYGLIFADSADVDQSGPTITAAEYNRSREQYIGQVVTVDGYHQQVASVEETEGATFQSQSSVIGTEASGIELSLPPGQASQTATVGVADSDASRSRQSLVTAGLGVNSPSVYGGSYNRPAWWLGADAETTVVVLPDGAAPSAWAPSEYVIETDVDTGTTVSPLGLQQRASELDGQLVTVTGQAVGVQISVQETLLEVAECAPESVTVPGGPGCVPLPFDVSIHTGALARTDSPSAVIPYVGLSSQHQDKSVTSERGEYRLTGRIVTADKIDPRLEAPYVLVVYERERIGGLDAAGVASTLEARAKSQQTALQNQTTLSAREYDAVQAAARQTPTATPTPTATVTASQSPSSSQASPRTDTPIVKTDEVRYTAQPAESERFNPAMLFAPRPTVGGGVAGIGLLFTFSGGVVASGAWIMSILGRSVAGETWTTLSQSIGVSTVITLTGVGSMVGGAVGGAVVVMIAGLWHLLV